MITPNVTIVAFNHSFDHIEIPMVKQENTKSDFFIEDNVWIASDRTIEKE